MVTISVSTGVSRKEGHKLNHHIEMGVGLVNDNTQREVQAVNEQKIIINTKSQFL